MNTPGVITNIEQLQEKMAVMRAAQKRFAAYSQEQVDAIFQAAAMAANKARIPLAKMAVEETGMGVAEDKVIKNHYAAEYIYNQYKNTKTVGVVEEDPVYGVQKIACHAERMETCRIVINMPSSQGAIGDIYNFRLLPFLTLGCGSWGGNSISHNVGVMDLLNIKTVAESRIEAEAGQVLSISWQQ